jgi:hypothetical protein
MLMSLLNVHHLITALVVLFLEVGMELREQEEGARC